MIGLDLEAIGPGTIVRHSRGGEVAVIGLGRSGTAVARLLLRAGNAVYASDAGSGEGMEVVAEALRGEGADVDVGGHDLSRIARADALVTSPGVRPDAPPIRVAAHAAVPVLGEVEIALRSLPSAQVIAVTGTNGKSTTTTLVAQLLRAAGRQAVEAGNIGTALSMYALEERPPEWIALELSSFQLRNVPSLNPRAGVVTNLASDHLDWYPDVKSYWDDKALLMLNDSEESCWILNGDDPEATALHRRLPEGHPSRKRLRGRVLHFSLHDSSADAFYSSRSGQLILFGEPLISRNEFPLLGPHNVANALAAALAVAGTAGEDGEAAFDLHTRLAGGLRTAAGLPHRMQPAGEFNGVLWINDSKATNVASTRVALEGMRRPYVLLLGGRHKGEPYTSLLEPMRGRVRAVIAYGEAAPIIQSDLGGVVPVVLAGDDFREVLGTARELAEPGDVILLSPACSSYDMFRNYDERGVAFMKGARGGLAGGNGP